MDILEKQIQDTEFYSEVHTKIRSNAPFIPAYSGGFEVLAYSGTPPYDHPVYKTTSLLRPYSFKPNVKNIESFYYFEDPVNATTSLLRPGFYGPTVVVLTGFHCTFMLNSLPRGKTLMSNTPSPSRRVLSALDYGLDGQHPL